MNIKTRIDRLEQVHREHKDVRESGEDARERLRKRLDGIRARLEMEPDFQETPVADVDAVVAHIRARLAVLTR